MASTPKISPRNEMAVPTHCRISSIGNDPRTENSPRASSKFRNSASCPVVAIRPIKPTPNGILSWVLKKREDSRAPSLTRGFRRRQPNASSAFDQDIRGLCAQREQMSPFSINQISTRAISGWVIAATSDFSINPSSDRSWARSSNKLDAKSKSNLESKRLSLAVSKRLSLVVSTVDSIPRGLRIFNQNATKFRMFKIPLRHSSASTVN